MKLKRLNAIICILSTFASFSAYSSSSSELDSARAQVENSRQSKKDKIIELVQTQQDLLDELERADKSIVQNVGSGVSMSIKITSALLGAITAYNVARIGRIKLLGDGLKIGNKQILSYVGERGAHLLNAELFTLIFGSATVISLTADQLVMYLTQSDYNKALKNLQKNQEEIEAELNSL